MLGRKLFGMRWVPCWIVVGLAVGIPNPASAQVDPFLGTWVLNLPKSRFNPAPGPKSQVAVYAAVSGGLQVTVTGVDAAGKPISFGYTAKIDGKDYPVTGNAEYDAVALKQTSPTALAFTRKKAGRVVQTGSNVVSADGKMRTVRVSGTVSGVKISNILVFDKQ